MKPQKMFSPLFPFVAKGARIGLSLLLFVVCTFLFTACNGDDEDDYYFITTERPDNRALDSLFNRTFGKAKETIDMTHREALPLLNVNNPNAIQQHNGNSTDNGTEQES